MTQYGVGPMNLTVENKTWCDNASVSLCQSKKETILVCIVKKENTRLLYTYVT